jgi:hypothetical protein
MDVTAEFRTVSMFVKFVNTAELDLLGLFGTAINPYNWIFFLNKLHRQFEVRLLAFTVCTCVETIRPRLL